MSVIVESQRGTGILNNELYIGRLTWNRLHDMRDPDMGKRVSRLNPQEDWIRTEVPELRIVTDALWESAKARQVLLRIRREASRGRQIGQRKRPKYLFSGLTKCSVCGGGYHMYNATRLACYAARGRGSCTNTRTIRRDEVEQRVPESLREHLLRRELFEEFCVEFTREMNRLQAEARGTATSMKHELVRVEAESKKLIDAPEGRRGVAASMVREEPMLLDVQRTQLKDALARADKPKPLLHPAMADIYREKDTGTLPLSRTPRTIYRGQGSAPRPGRRDRTGTR